MFLFDPVTRQPTPRPLMCFPHITSNLDPVRMNTLVRLWRITDPQYPRSIFLRKSSLWQTGILRSKSTIFSRLGTKCKVDNNAGIRYLNLSRRYMDENGHTTTGIQHIVICPTIAHKPKIRLNTLSKSKFLSDNLHGIYIGLNFKIIGFLCYHFLSMIKK